MATVVTVVNESEVDVVGWDATMGYVLKSQLNVPGSACTTNADDFPAGAAVEVKLPVGEPDDPAMTWSINLRKQGLAWAPGGQVEGTAITVVPGGTYTIVLDDANPHISDDDKGIITQRIYDAIEAHVPYPDVWATVHANTPASIKGCRTVEQLEEAHDGHNTFQWHELYRSVGVETWASESEINAALQLGGGARIEVYWRALGRFPGGNADMLTVCYSFKCGGPAAPASVSVRKYSNWDGSHSNCEFVPEALTADLAKPEKLPRLLGSLRGYLSGPSRDSQFTFHDTSFDSEEYDSEWSSTEILMLLPRRWSPAAHPFFPKAVRDSVLTVMLANQRVRGAGRPALSMDELRLVFAAFVPSIDHVPVLRLHRQCVTGPTQAYWSRPATEGEPVVAPNPQQQAVIEAAEVVVGMGRVNTYSDAGDGEDPCLAAGETEVDIESNQCDFRIRLPYVQPCYFRWAAKNC